MKKIVAAFIKSLGGEARYSGNKKTMFIHGPATIETECIKHFGRHFMPFNIETSKVQKKGA